MLISASRKIVSSAVTAATTAGTIRQKLLSRSAPCGGSSSSSSRIASRKASTTTSSTRATHSAEDIVINDGLSNSGKLFFGSLCVGTFGLGVWQLQRLLEKLDMIEDREKQLSLQPIEYQSSSSNTSSFITTTSADNDMITNDDNNTANPYRRRLLRGIFRHEKEVLIGPRGAPAGVQMPVQGLSAKQAQNKKTSTSAAGGMQPGPQGFHILTPLELVGPGSSSYETGNKKQIVWINRGWVPRTIVPGANQSHFKSPNGQIDVVQKAKLDEELSRPCQWNRPPGIIEMTTIVSKPEKPKFITPVHDYSKRPLQLFWVDGVALKAIAYEQPSQSQSTGDTTTDEEEVSLLIQVVDYDTNDDTDTTTNNTTNAEEVLLYPLQPPVSTITQFKTTPSVHAGYAFTWFGLSTAGLYMTRKLISKGRF